MKTLKYILILFLALGTFHSCLVDDETKYDLNDKGPNLAGFEINRTTVSGIADGTEYTFPMKVKIVGPTVMDLTSDIDLTVSVDASSTAVEGTHYRIDNPTVTLTAANNYLGLVDITMLTTGIATPLAEAPILILNAESAVGDDMVTNNGKQLEITMNFACYSEFQGNYDMTVIYTATTGAVTTFTRNEVITKTGVEEYRTTYVGHWTPAQMAPGTPGFTFMNSCNKLTIPNQLLASYWANEVEGTAIGTADPVTGDLYMEYSVCYGGACRYYKCTYVRK